MAAIGLYHEHRPSEVQDAAEWSAYLRKRRSSIESLGPEEEAGAREGLEALMLAGEKLVGSAICVDPKVIGYAFEEQDKILESIDSPLMHNPARERFRRSIVECQHVDGYKPVRVEMIVSDSTTARTSDTRLHQGREEDLTHRVRHSFDLLEGRGVRMASQPDALQAEVMRSLDQIEERSAFANGHWAPRVRAATRARESLFHEFSGPGLLALSVALFALCVFFFQAVMLKTNTMLL